MQATIRNEFLTLTVDTHGAEAVSLKNAAGEELDVYKRQEDAEDAPCPQAARLKASTRLRNSAAIRWIFMVLLLCCFGI